MLSIPHILDSRLKDGGKVVSPTHPLHSTPQKHYFYVSGTHFDRLCGLVVRVLGYRSGGPSSIPGTTKEKKVMGLERGSLSVVSTTEELLDRKVAVPV
jgi:hypothetical protein